VNPANTLANCWRKIELATIGKRVLVTVNQSKHALHLRDTSTLMNERQDERETTFNFVSDFCPAVWGVSTAVLKELLKNFERPQCLLYEALRGRDVRAKKDLC